MQVALDDLRSKQAEVEQELNTAQAYIDQLRLQLQKLTGAIGALDEVARLQELLEGHPAFEPDDLEHSTPAGEPATGRVRSTALMADVVNRMTGPASRDAIFKAYELAHGIPSTWSDPANSMAMALNRAWKKGLVQRIGSEYAPRDFAPAGES